ncbi:hypothetical protein YC2023_028180 [Brassica napus]
MSPRHMGKTYLRVWRCVSLRTIFLGFVSSVTVALLGLDLVVHGSWVSSAPLRVPLGSTEEARMVLFRVGSGLPCSRILWRCVLVLRSLAVSSSSWRVRLVATPRSRSGWVGGSNLQLTSPNDGIVGCGFLLVLPALCVSRFEVAFLSSLLVATTSPFRSCFSSGPSLFRWSSAQNLVGHLGEAYEEWVHQPIVTKEGPRFFHSDFWEVHKFLSPFLFSNRQCQQASDLHYLDTLAMETVLDPYKMVGDSCNLVASGMLVHLQVSKHGPFPYRNRPIDCLGNIYLDVHRIYSSPVPFPHQDQELLGKHGALSSSRMSSQAPNGPPSARLSSCCNSGFMLSFLEPCEAFCNSVNHTCLVWRWNARCHKAGSTQVAWNTMCLSTAEGHTAVALFLEDIAATDVMKLLELEKPEDESHYNMARESLLSPDLPRVDFLDSLIVNEDKNPATALDLVARDSVDLSDTINSSEASNFSTQNASVTDKMPPMSTTRCPSVTRAEWAVPAILFSLKMEENLLARDMVCVFLSLLLHNFSVVSSMNIGNILYDNACSCLDSFSKHIDGVMADTEARCILSEFLEELLTLFSRIALIDHLVAGSAILAAICTAVDRVGFIREASFEILHKYCHEKTSMPLTILHVFAHIAGEKVMSSNDHDISIAVLKSIVMCLEKKHFGTVEGNAYMHPRKNKCLFSVKSSSLEAMASILMEIIQEFTKSNTLHQSLTEKSEFRAAHKDFQNGIGLVQTLLFHCLRYWECHLSVAIVSLLGELSSVGVDAGGYENEGISNLREKLSAFLQCETTLKAGFAVQVATVSSLVKTLHLDFSVVVQGKTTMLPGCGDQSLSASANLVQVVLFVERRTASFLKQVLTNLCC